MIITVFETLYLLGAYILGKENHPHVTDHETIGKTVIWLTARLGQSCDTVRNRSRPLQHIYNVLLTKISASSFNRVSCIWEVKSIRGSTYCL